VKLSFIHTRLARERPQKDVGAPQASELASTTGFRLVAGRPMRSVGRGIS
jgi:hypothetical protein